MYFSGGVYVLPTKFDGILIYYYMEVNKLHGYAASL